MNIKNGLLPGLQIYNNARAQEGIVQFTVDCPFLTMNDSEVARSNEELPLGLRTFSSPNSGQVHLLKSKYGTEPDKKRNTQTLSSVS